jgi:hypothetical protein
MKAPSGSNPDRWNSRCLFCGGLGVCVADEVAAPPVAPKVAAGRRTTARTISGRRIASYRWEVHERRINLAR